jgi:hypothetical protein
LSGCENKLHPTRTTYLRLHLSRQASLMQLFHSECHICLETSLGCGTCQTCPGLTDQSRPQGRSRNTRKHSSHQFTRASAPKLLTVISLVDLRCRLDGVSIIGDDVSMLL